MTEAFFVSLGGLALAFLVFFLSDRLWDTPLPLRWALFAAAFSGLLVFAPYWLVKWVFLRRTPIQLALLVEKISPSMGDKLRGVLEISSDAAPNSAASEKLRAAAIDQASRDVEKLDMRMFIPHPRAKRYGGICLALLAIAAAVSIQMPEAAGNAFVRLLTPAGCIERFTFTRLMPFDAVLAVPIGEESRTDFELSGTSRHEPETARYRLAGREWREAKLNPATRKYAVDIPPLQTETQLEFAAGDFRAGQHIIPRPRPALQRAFVQAAMPGYIGGKTMELPIRAGTASILKGAQATLKAQATQRLKAVITDTPGEVKIEGNTVVFPTVTMGDHPEEISFTWIDAYGLKGHGMIKIKLEPAADQPPVASLQTKASERYVLPDTSMEIHVEASDDFGVKDMGLAWFTEDKKDAPDGAPASDSEVTLKTGKPDEEHLKSSFVFQADEQGITPQRVVIRAFATDHNPERSRVWSAPLVIYVLSLEEHAQMIRTSLDKLAANLEDVIRNMDAMSDEIADLRKQSDSGLKADDQRKRLDTLAAQEENNTIRLEELRAKSEQILKEATRNRQIDPDAMANLMMAIQKMPNVTKRLLPSAKSNFEQSASRQNDTPGKELQQGEQSHQEAVKELKEAGAILSDAQSQMEASTYAARLKYAVRQEKSLISGLSHDIQQLAGKIRGKMSTGEQNKIDGYTELQASTAKLVGWIADELNHYRNREGVEPVYGEIYSQMINSNIVGKLDQVSESLKEALPGISIEDASGCLELLEKWLAMLDDSQNSGAGGGGGNKGDSKSLSDKDFEFLLKIMRMIQQQQDIRMRTRALEQSKARP